MIEQNSIAINDERARREIKLLDHPRIKNLGTNSRPTFAGFLKMIMSEPRTPPTLIQASETSETGDADPGEESNPVAGAGMNKPRPRNKPRIAHSDGGGKAELVSAIGRKS